MAGIKQRLEEELSYELNSYWRNLVRLAELKRMSHTMIIEDSEGFYSKYDLLTSLINESEYLIRILIRISNPKADGSIVEELMYNQLDEDRIEKIRERAHKRFIAFFE